MNLQERQRRVAVQILEYLVKHPGAKDTLDGIRQWWLHERQACTPEDVRAATADLVTRGFMRTWEASPGLCVFGPGPRLVAAQADAVAQYREESRSIH